MQLRSAAGSQHHRERFVMRILATLVLLLSSEMFVAIAAGATQTATPDAAADRTNAHALLRSINSYNLIKSDGLVWMIPIHRALWTSASSFCNESTIGGRLGWRLPTAVEVIRLYANHAKSLPQYWPRDYIWTSTRGSVVSLGFPTHVSAVTTNGPAEDDHYRGFVACVHEIGP